ncbi:GNAT family N-acetyltransferase [Clostridium sp. CTA-19]
MKGNIEVRKANISDINRINDIMFCINDLRAKSTEYDDYKIYHSRSSLEEVLKGNKDEMIFIAVKNKRLIGMLNFSFNNPNYMFFADKFIYINYLYVDTDYLQDEYKIECVTKKLFDNTIIEMKKYGFKYICADVLSKEYELREILEKNHMKSYRHRLCKKIKTV